MSIRERIVIYGILALLLGVNMSALLDGHAQSAVADTAWSADRLGPAEALTLVDDDQQLVLRNKAGRLAWADSDHARAFSLGFVHVGKAVGPLLEAERYVEQRQRLEDEIKATDEELDARVAAFMEEHRDLDPNDPDAGEVRRAYQELFAQREQWRLERARRMAQLRAEQIEGAYRDLVAAVEVVAERLDIDLVLRFIPTADELQAINPTQAFTAIRARIALKYPEALDITEKVLQELALEVE